MSEKQEIGRELDRLVAERLGWTRIRTNMRGLYGCAPGSSTFSRVPRYSHVCEMYATWNNATTEQRRRVCSMDAQDTALELARMIASQEPIP